jgi:peptidoglycan/LPS O-acetylase OafA/YrhL
MRTEPGAVHNTALRFESPVAVSRHYRADIDGLRAIAVLSVLFFHVDIVSFKGGFAGVDVFFVISGFLIASLIARDIDTKRFSFVAFYERRIRRIFPALFAVSFFSVIAAAVLFDPQEFSAFGKSLMAMTGFVSNIFFGTRPESYFDTSSSPVALLHTWSLSVEEQFYLLFPMGLLLLRRFAKRYEVRLLLLAIGASFAFSIWGSFHEPVATFYMLAPRAWELLLGAVLAVSSVPPLNHRLMRELTGGVGLALVGYALTMFAKQTNSPSLHALFPCVGACLILYAGQGGESCVKKLLSLRPLVFIGVISYSVYLWHWPIIVFGKYIFIGSLTKNQTFVIVLCSLLAGFLSFEFIEAPLRGKDSTISRRQVYEFAITASVISLALGLTIDSSKGFPQRFDAKTREIVFENSERKSDFDESCGNWKTEIRAFADIESCQVGNTASHKILFWGDSHVQQLMPLIKNMHAEGKLQGKGAVFFLEVACPLAEDMNNVQESGYHCDTFARFAMIRAHQEDIDTVFIGFDPWWAWTPNSLCLSADGRCLRILSAAESIQYFLEELSRHIHDLRAAGKRVIVQLPMPVYDKSIPDLEIHNAFMGSLLGESVPSEVCPPILREEILSVAQDAGADIFDPRESLCEGQKCTYQVGGVSIYKDDNHIAASQIGILEANLFSTLSSRAGPRNPRPASVSEHASD